MTALTEKERDAINEKVRRILHKSFIDNAENKLYEDLVGLYQEITAELEKHGKEMLVYDYAKLLEAETMLYDAEDIYLLAKNSRELSDEEIVNLYMYGISMKLSDSGIDVDQLVIYNEICELLGETRGLLNEFTETYRSVNGAIVQNIEQFVNLGCFV